MSKKLYNYNYWWNFLWFSIFAMSLVKVFGLESEKLEAKISNSVNRTKRQDYFDDDDNDHDNYSNGPSHSHYEDGPGPGPQPYRHEEPDHHRGPPPPPPEHYDDDGDHEISSSSRRGRGGGGGGGHYGRCEESRCGENYRHCPHGCVFNSYLCGGGASYDECCC